MLRAPADHQHQHQEERLVHNNSLVVAKSSMPNYFDGTLAIEPLIVYQPSELLQLSVIGKLLFPAFKSWA